MNDCQDKFLTTRAGNSTLGVQEIRFVSLDTFIGNTEPIPMPSTDAE